jgi:hypothetical protein
MGKSLTFFYSVAEWLERLAVKCQCLSRNSPHGFDPSILRHSGIWGAADKAVLNNVHKKKNPKRSPLRYFWDRFTVARCRCRPIRNKSWLTGSFVNGESDSPEALSMVSLTHRKLCQRWVWLTGSFANGESDSPEALPTVSPTHRKLCQWWVWLTGSSVNGESDSPEALSMVSLTHQKLCQRWVWLTGSFVNGESDSLVAGMGG